MVATWLTSFPDPNIFYQDIQALFTEVGPPYYITSNGLATPNLNFLMSLVDLVILRASQYSANYSQSQCDNNHPTSYSHSSIETWMLTLGLISLSWLKVNIKKKVEDGHCHNPNHHSPAKCNIGSSFHRELYDDLVSITREILSKLEACSPNVLTNIDSDPIVREMNDNKSSSSYVKE